MFSTIKRAIGFVESGRQFRINAAGISDVGLEREVNEDRFSILTQPDILRSVQALLVVGDGMGGHVGGQIASEIGVLTVQQSFDRGPSLGRTEPTSPLEHLKYSIENANSGVRQHAAEHPELAGMGTTITAVAIAGDQLLIGHVGDSRAYIIEGNEIKQLTRDHSWVADQVELGLLKPEEAKNHPRRSMITRAVGLRDEVKVDSVVIHLPKKLNLLICSDGLYDLVDDDEMLDTIMSKRTPEQACKQLVRMANDRGGHDNITVIVARVTVG